MATNHTKNYQLNLWEPSDKFVRTEFNENSEKIDAAIKAVDTKANGKADASALAAETSAREAAVKAETDARNAAVSAINSTLSGKARIAVGSYTGNGAKSRTINVGFTPKAVLLFNAEGYTSYGSYQYGGLAVTGSPATCSSVAFIEIVSNGFCISQPNEGGPAVPNYSSRKFNYLAIA